MVESNSQEPASAWHGHSYPKKERALIFYERRLSGIARFYKGIMSLVHFLKKSFNPEEGLPAWAHNFGEQVSI